MSLLEYVRNTVRSEKSSYACRYCNLTFDREVTNCPACGWSDVE